MQNKENNPFSMEKSSIYMTHKPKSSLRYPLREVDSQFNSRNASPVPLKQKLSNLKQNISSNLGQYSLATINKSQVSMSMNQKFRRLQTNSVHDLISLARQKKRQIEQLLIKEEKRANLQGLEQIEIGSSHRKLRKVVRLMEIVCKIILGRSDHNSYLDLGSHQDIYRRQMQCLSVQNYERELTQKNNEISRLKKLVQILSAPPGPNASMSKQDDCILLDSPDLSEEKSKFDSVRRSLQEERNKKIQKETVDQYTQVSKDLADISIQTERLQKNMAETSIQTQQLQEMVSISLQTQQIYINEVGQGENLTKIVNSFSICEQYSLWNILDAKMQALHKQTSNGNVVTVSASQTESIPELHEQQTNEKLDTQVQQYNQQNKQNTSLNTTCRMVRQQQKKKLCIIRLYEVSIASKSPFLKRYKSMVKLTINSLNMLNNIYIRAGSTQADQIGNHIIAISQYFNLNYHQLHGCYDDGFCKVVREKVGAIYDRIYEMSGQGEFDEQSILDI